MNYRDYQELYKRRQDEKEKLILDQFGKLSRLIYKLKKDVSITLRMYENEPQVDFFSQHLKTFSIYSFCSLEQIKAGFKLIEESLKTGTPIAVHSTCDLLENKEQ